MLLVWTHVASSVWDGGVVERISYVERPNHPFFNFLRAGSLVVVSLRCEIGEIQAVRAVMEQGCCRSGMCDAESDCVFCVFEPCARIPWFWGLNNNNLVKSLHFPQALTGLLTRLLPGSRARQQARKDLRCESAKTLAKTLA
jgi:hypothetical protein